MAISINLQFWSAVHANLRDVAEECLLVSPCVVRAIALSSATLQAVSSHK